MSNDHKDRLLAQERELRRLMHKLWGRALEKAYFKREWGEFQGKLSAYFKEVKKLFNDDPGESLH